MRPMLRLLDDWDPVAYADLHVTDGADFEHDVSSPSGRRRRRPGIAALCGRRAR